MQRGNEVVNLIIGAVAGGGFGFIIGKYLSRFEYGCPILCNPKISTFYFAIMGIIFASGQ
jgi:hypothetical protein